MAKSCSRATWCLIFAFAGLGIAAAAPAEATLAADQVLIVYNSADADSLAVYNHYQSVHPQVYAFDLNDATLAPGNISYSNFESKVRDPIRDYLTTNNLVEQVHAITLTKGIPHRINDINGTAGTTLNYGLGRLTYASADSELALLWEDLDAGESGGTFDSHADNLIINPYHRQSRSITAFDRSSIGSNKNFVRQSLAWQLRDDATTLTDGGGIYLVARLDGDTAAQVNAAVDRAQNIRLNPRTDRVIIDDKNTQSSASSSFNALNNALSTIDYDAVTYDQGPAFLVGDSGDVADPDAVAVTGPVSAVIGWGGNHSGADQDGYLDTFDGQLVDGAVFSSFESFNGRPFGGLGAFGDQGSVAEWIANGGTFGIGNANEPFTFSIADADHVLPGFFTGELSWIEAAWSGIPYLSWQQLVVGDPLARVTLVPEPGVMAWGGTVLAVVLLRRRTERLH